MEEMKPRPKQSADNVEQAPASEIRSAKHMVVGIDGRLFALPVENVREIVRMPPWVNVPKKPEHIRGMINLRGKIIRLVDTRKFLGMKSKIEELDALQAVMSARKQDHIRWMQELEASIIEKRTFALATDPTKCAFGKWYYSYKPPTYPIALYLKHFETPHNAIHALAHRVLTLAENGKHEESLAVIRESRNTTLAQMLRLFDGSAEEFREGSRELALVIEHKGETIAIAVDSAETIESIGANDISEIADTFGCYGNGSKQRVAQHGKTGNVFLMLNVEDLFVK